MPSRFSRTRATGVAIMCAAAIAVSALTPTVAYASNNCSAIAAGAFRAVYNATGSAVLAAKVAEMQYTSCVTIDWFTR